MIEENFKNFVIELLNTQLEAIANEETSEESEYRDMYQYENHVDFFHAAVMFQINGYIKGRLEQYLERYLDRDERDMIFNIVYSKSDAIKDMVNQKLAVVAGNNN